MSVTPILKKRVSDQVFEEMKAKIAEKEWKIGEKIPSELQLMKLYGVSRISIREAIKQLMCLGLLETKQGSGTFVCSYHEPNALQSLSPILSKQDLLELLEMRRGIEIESVGLLASRATPTDTVILREICLQMEDDSITPELNSQLDMRFHIAIAKATRNKYIIDIMEVISEPLLHFFNTTAFLNFSKGNGLQRHKHILSAIENHNVQEARLIMELHLDDTMQIIANEVNTSDFLEKN